MKKMWLTFILVLTFSTYSFSGMLLDVYGESARSLYNKFEVEGVFDYAYYTQKNASGKLNCTRRAPWGSPASYFCDFAEAQTVVLNISGDLAETVFGKLDVKADFDGAYHTFKNAYGKLNCSQQTTWGNPSSYACTFVSQD